MNKLREANKTLRQKNVALRTTINNLTREIAEIRRLLLGNTEPPQRPTPITSKTEETNTNSQEAAVEEPVLKKGAVEATRKQKENDNLEANFEARFTKFEELIMANIAAVTTMKQTVDSYQAENMNRISHIERTLQPIVSHPTFAPPSSRYIHPTKEPRTRQRNHGRQRSRSRRNSVAVELSRLRKEESSHPAAHRTRRAQARRGTTTRDTHRGTITPRLQSGQGPARW
ncbi:hypothetical protein MTO96_017488 [Rhipicephalus appendiculatus]